MSFRNDFFDIIEASNPALPMSAAMSVGINTMNRGLTAVHGDIRALQEGIEACFSQSAELGTQTSSALAAEIAFQSELNRECMMDAARGMVATIEQAKIYLGNQIAEVRWAVERNTEVTQAILDSLWKTHWIDSRQYFDEGVQCYESGEREFARERFEKATVACRTNGFAYQYLGFLSVHDNDQAQALRNFELAAKFAPNDHYRAIAHYHLTRAWQAAGNPHNALEHIQATVNLMPNDLTYRFELVRSLMRDAKEREALQELRSLIVTDMRYWTAAAIDRTLEPMRAGITQLLDQMREHARSAAELVNANYLDTIRLIESLPDPMPEAAGYPRVWTGSQNSPAEDGTVFEYRNTIRTVPVSHRACVEREIERYDMALAKQRSVLISTPDNTLSRAKSLRDEINSLRSEAERVDSQLLFEERHLDEENAVRAQKYWWTIWLTILGVPGGLFYCAPVFWVGGEQGLANLITVVIFFGMSAIFPVSLIRRRTALLTKKIRARTAARTKLSEIEGQIRIAEDALRKVEKTGAEQVFRFQSDYEALQSRYVDILRSLRERLAVAHRDETVLATLWS